MKKGAILKKIENLENKIIDSVQELQDFLDQVEDPDISYMGTTLCDRIIDEIYENDTMTLNEIKNFIQNEYEQ